MDSAPRALISGASIAGPVAAFWLQRAGWDVTVVERVPALRMAGQNIDVRGTARQVLRRMDLEAAVLAAGTGECGLRFVDEHNAVIAEFPAGSADSDGFTAEVEVLRGELARLLVGASGANVDYLFGEQITALRPRDGGVDVTLAGGGQHRFDLVVLADGARSRTREMVFGPAAVRDLGLYTAYGTIARTSADDQWWAWYNAPGGRVLTTRPDNLGTTRVTLSFLSEPRGYEDLPVADQRAVLAAKFAGAGWQADRILDALADTDELYVDYLQQVRMPSWSNGRVVLLGDAAWCAAPVSGMGTTLAITGGYALAEELAAGGDVDAALRRYEERMRPMVTSAQRLPPGVPRLAHPKSRAGVAAMRIAARTWGFWSKFRAQMTKGPTLGDQGRG